MTEIAEITLQEIVQMLEMKKKVGKDLPILFLGSRTGSLYGNSELYESIKSFSKYQIGFDSLSDTEKFKETYEVLKERYKNEAEIFTVFKALLPDDLQPRYEDRYMVDLLRAEFFDIVISTAIDPLLEEAWALGKYLLFDSPETFFINKYKVLVLDQDTDVEICRIEWQTHKIIKIFGSLSTMTYRTVGKEFDFDGRKPEHELKVFLEETLSRDILVIGYDPVWDRPLENVFLEKKGGFIYYINEERPTEGSHLDLVIQKRQGKYHTGEQGSYRRFLADLHSKLLLDKWPGYEYVRRVSTYLKTIQDKVETVNENVLFLRKAVQELLDVQNLEGRKDN